MLDTRPAFLFDVDGVMLDWCSGFLAWMAESGHRVVHAPPVDFAMTNCLPFLPPEEKLGLVELFNRSRAYAGLEFFPGAGWALATLREAYNDHRFVVVTATGSGFDTIRHRANALHGFGFDDAHFLGVTEKKADIFARYPRGSIVFEDTPAHAAAALAGGHRVVFFERSYNGGQHCQHARQRRVASWDEVPAAVADLLAGAPCVGDHKQET